MLIKAEQITQKQKEKPKQKPKRKVNISLAWCITAIMMHHYGRLIVGWP